MGETRGGKFVAVFHSHFSIVLRTLSCSLRINDRRVTALEQLGIGRVMPLAKQDCAETIPEA